MSLTVSTLKTLMNTYLGDSSTDQISDTERNNLLTEAVVWLNEELQNEHNVSTYELNFLDKIYKYKVTSSLADLLIGADLRREPGLNTPPFARKSPREIWSEIAEYSQESSWAVERYDDQAYLIINHIPTNKRYLITSFDSTTDGGGTWTADTSGSDATNVTVDINEFQEGTASLNFDVDVSQSANNRATIYNAATSTKDLSKLEDLGTFTLDIYIPDATNISSVTLKWSDETSVTPSTLSKYWSATVTTDIDGGTFADGWNTIKVDWSDATTTGSPDSSALVYFQIDINYTGSQVDDTDFRLDNFAITKSEKLTFHFVSFYVGTNSGGTNLLTFTADTDIPFFSGKYDQYKYAVGHKAASLAFYSPLRLTQEGATEEAEAIKSLRRYKKTFESSIVRETRNFKPHGVSFRHRRIRIR